MNYVPEAGLCLKGSMQGISSEERMCIVERRQQNGLQVFVCMVKMCHSDTLR